MHMVISQPPHRRRVVGIRTLCAAAVALVAIATLLAPRSLAAVDGAPVAHWTFDDGAGGIASESIADLDGSIVGASWIADGQAGSALRFEGDDAVAIAADARWSTPRLAVSLWVRGDQASPPPDGAIILELGDRDCAGGDYAIAVDGDSVELRVRDDEMDQIVRVRTADPGVASLWNGAWHHIGMNYVAGEFGGVTLLVDGNIRGGASIGSLDHSTLTVQDLVVGRAAREGCGRLGFEGDIDDIRFFDDVMSRDGFAGLEPPIATVTSIVAVDPLTVGVGANVEVDIEPVPISGVIKVFVVDEDGVEHLVGARDIEYWTAHPLNGQWTVGITSDWGGSGPLIVRSELGPPHVPSEASRPVTIAKQQAWASLSSVGPYVAGEPIALGVLTGPVGPNIHPTGTIELYDVSGAAPVLLDSSVIVDNPSSATQGVDFLLAPRPAGAYRFEARYLGGLSHLPAVGTSSLEVLPALNIGQVVINAGAATTGNPVVTVSTPAQGASAVWVSTDPTDSRRSFTAAYEDQITTWLTAPWYGDDADGVRTVWIKWADHLGRWSDMKSDTIILDRGLPTGVVLIDDGAASTNDRWLTVGVPVPDPTLVTSVGLSADGIDFQTYPYAPSIEWLAPEGAGSITVHARWRDSEGRWSMTRSDSILLDITPPTGNILVLGDEADLASTRILTLDAVASDTDSGVTEVALSNDGVAWTIRAYAPTQPWQLPAGDGTHIVYAKWKDGAGNWSAVASRTVVLDTVAPTVSAPIRTLVAGSTVVGGRATARLSWTGTDATSGIAGYDVAQQTDVGAWTTIGSAIATRTTDRGLATGHSYRFRVRPVDRAGNVGAWVTGPKFELTRFQESSGRITYSGSWRTATSTSFWGGAARRSSAAGAKASITFSGRSAAWVSAVGPNRGKAAVYVNGNRVATIDLYAKTTATRRVVWAANWSTSASRRITIKVLGTAGRPRVDIDAIITSN